MRAMIVAALLAIGLASHAFAATAIHSIYPESGFTFAPTHVTIGGTGFTDGEVEVYFGAVKAQVLQVSATSLRVRAFPPNDPLMRDTSADVIVRVSGHGEAVLGNGFWFSTFAQAGQEDYNQLLVPLTVFNTPGANGSVWSAELNVFNSSELHLRMPGPEMFIAELPVDPAVVVEPRKTQNVQLRTFFRSEGAFLYVPKALADAPKWSLRVRDLSQNATSLGADVPVVQQSDGRPDITLIDIPTDPRFRATLRIYGFTPGAMLVGVRVYRELFNFLLAEYDVFLNGRETFEAEEFTPYPSYIALDPLTPEVRAAAAGRRVRIELTNYGSNVSPPPPNIWAFVSLTHNETQQVTVVTPR
jgi:hypothetical protein